MDHRRIYGTPGLWLLCVALALLAACGKAVHDPRLSVVNSMADEDPAKATAMLDSIDKATLNDYNRRYYDLLRIKTADKAYVRHTSDSLYQTVLGFFENKKGDPHYPEVIYYGGRVYSDLGDYPRALQYFQKSLELIPDDDANLQLRLNALSQTGRLLSELRLYEEAIPYLEKCVTFDTKLKDSLNLFHDLKLLSNSYRNRHDFQNAENNLKRAAGLLKEEDVQNIMDIRGETAFLKFMQGDTSSALSMIQGVPDIIEDRVSKDHFSAVAAHIYYGAGIHDTAYIYADKVKDSDNVYKQRTGYRVLLSPGVIELSNPDSISSYMTRYLGILEGIYNENGKDASIVQNSQYNYSIFEKENNLLKITQDRLERYLWLTLFMVMLAIVGFILFRIHNLRQLINLRQSLDMIRTINDNYRTKKDIIVSDIKQKGLKELSAELQSEIRHLESILNGLEEDHNKYIESAAFEKIREYIEKRENIPNNAWNIIFESLDECSPGFFKRINELAQKKLSSDELRMIALIRMDVNPSSIAFLMSKSKSTISYRRKKLCEKLNLDPKNLETMDKIIQHM